MTITTLRARVRMWQRRTHLTDWNVSVVMVDKLKVRRKSCHAATSVNLVDKRVDIEFDRKSVAEADRETLDHLICHELQHVVHHDEDEVLSKFLGGYKSKVYREWADANEKVCDAAASALVGSYRRKRDIRR